MPLKTRFCPRPSPSLYLASSPLPPQGIDFVDVDMSCDSLSNISSGTNWPADVTDLCLETYGCVAVTVYYSPSYEEYMYCLNSANSSFAETNATQVGPQGSTACLGIYYACEYAWGVIGWPRGSIKKVSCYSDT